MERIQDAEVWNDPVVQETVVALGELGEIGLGGDVNDEPAVKLLLETECFDPVVVSAAMCTGLWWRSSLPTEVGEIVDIAGSKALRDEGAGPVLASGNLSALRLAVLNFSLECRPDALAEAFRDYGAEELRPLITRAADTAIDLADSMTEKGTWSAIPHRLLDKFTESLNGIAAVVESPSRRKVLQAASAEIKTLVARAAAEEIAPSAPPQIDPESPFVANKGLVKSKFKLRP